MSIAERKIQSIVLSLDVIQSEAAQAAVYLDFEPELTGNGKRGPGVKVEFHVPFDRDETRDALERKCMGIAAQLFERLARESQSSLLSSYNDTFTRPVYTGLSNEDIEKILDIEKTK